MNENRYSPPTSRVADLAPPPVDSTAATGLATTTTILWASLALGLVNAALQWTYMTSTAPIGAVVGLMIFTFSVIGFLTYHIGRGRNWARIIFLVLAIIGLPSLLQLPAVFSRDPLSGSLSLLQSVLQFAALYMVFATPARHAFNKRNDVV